MIEVLSNKMEAIATICVTQKVKTITEIETIKSRLNNDFNQFSNDVIMQRSVERDLEIIGEAV